MEFNNTNFNQAPPKINLAEVSPKAKFEYNKSEYTQVLTLVRTDEVLKP